jgi:hypothetical protein
MATYQGQPVTVGAPIVTPPLTSITTASGQVLAVPTANVTFTEDEAKKLRDSDDAEYKAAEESRKSDYKTDKKAFTTSTEKK